MTFLLLLDYIGTVAFAASGALKGIRKQMDIFGVMVLAAATAIGGGTVRDALLDERIFWLQDSRYMLFAIGMALIVFLLHRAFERTETPLLVFDAVGLGVFTAIGAMKAEAADTGVVGIVTMACLTGVGGGMMRDVLAREIPIVLREEIYASASILGAFAYYGMRVLEAGDTAAICVGAAVTIVLRLLSIFFGWHLPRRAARTEADET